MKWKIIQKVEDARRKIAFKLLGGKSPGEVLSKRIRLFVVVGIVLIGASKLLYLAGITFPNLELIIPTLVVIGSFSLYTGPSERWEKLTRYFGVVAIVSVYLIDLAFWGFRPIFAFTWTGFILAWFLGMRNKLSMFDDTKKLLYHTTLTAAIAILAFDAFTATGWWLLRGAHSFVGLSAVYLAQIPFTFYHLASLIFVPPLVGLGKALAKVKVRVKVPIREMAKIPTAKQ